MVAQVIVQSDTRALDRCFSYAVPEFMIGELCEGMQVSVPFGMGNRLKSGVVLSLSDEEPPETLKFISAIENNAVICPACLLSLVEFLREKTFCSYQDALRVLLPPGGRARFAEFYALSKEVNEEQIEQAIGRSTICYRIIEVLRAQGLTEYGKLCSALSRGSLRTQLKS